MSALILAVDSGLDGAFVWMRGGVVLHHVLTRNIVRDGRIDMGELKDKDALAFDTACMSGTFPSPQLAYLEEPFNPGMTGRANSAGFAGSCMRFGRLQGWLESWGYEVRSVRPQKWQRAILDLAKFEVRTEKACAPRLAEGWTLRVTGAEILTWTLSAKGREPIRTTAYSRDRTEGMKWAIARCPEAILTTKQVLSHDTKAASIAYAREHFPGVELVPPQATSHVGTKHAPPSKPHDGLADALCIAAWASKKETP